MGWALGWVWPSPHSRAVLSHSPVLSESRLLSLSRSAVLAEVASAEMSLHAIYIHEVSSPGCASPQPHPCHRPSPALCCTLASVWPSPRAPHHHPHLATGSLPPTGVPHGAAGLWGGGGALTFSPQLHLQQQQQSPVGLWVAAGAPKRPLVTTGECCWGVGGAPRPTRGCGVLTRPAPGSAARASQLELREMPLGGWAEEDEEDEDEEEEQTTK